MGNILTSIKAQFSWHHLCDVIKNFFFLIGLLVTILQGAEYLLPNEFVRPVVAFCRENTMWKFLFILIGVWLIKWEKLGYLWKCKTMEVSIEIKCCNFFNQEGSRLVQFADTFDTDMNNNKLVKPDSVNGEFIQLYYKNNVQQLDETIETTLSKNNVKFKENNRLRGKKKVYQRGTIIPITVQNTNYFLTAFSKMRLNGNTLMSKVDYSDFLASLWQKLSSVNVQDETLNVTVFGASSISGLPADFKFQDKLHEIIKSFLLASRNRRICKKLRICMRPEDYQQLDYADIKHFATYFDGHLSHIENNRFTLKTRRGQSFNPSVDG